MSQSVVRLACFMVGVGWLSTVASPAHAATAAPSPPQGWTIAGSAPQDYQVAVDPDAHSGKAAGSLRSKAGKTTTAGFGTLMQSFKADQFRGQRVRLTAWVKSENVESWSGVWMRVDGRNKRDMLAFDNMQNRPITGTTPWMKYQVVLDVAPEAAAIAFGILLHGTGAVWIDDLSFEAVDKSVPTTDGSGTDANPADPQNLGFEG